MNRPLGHDLAYMLHAVPYKETSLIVELFCREYGRVPVVAKGAKRPHSALRSVLLNFQPLTVRFSGRGEVKTLTQAEWCGALMPPEGKRIFAAYYLNELLLQGLGREDSHPALFDDYTTALARLSEGEDLGIVVRQFEIDLLRELGFGFDFSSDSAGNPIMDDQIYSWVTDLGWVSGSSSEGAAVVSGRNLLSLEVGLDRETALALKPFTRHLLMTYISPRGLHSRVWMEQLVKHD